MRIIVKIGTSSLCDSAGQFDRHRLQGLALQLASLVEEGLHLIVVSSGAIGAGIGRIGILPRQMKQKQALAAIGQALVMQAYQQCFAAIPLAQVLLTSHDLSDPERRESSRQTLEQLLEWGVMPIVNENDTVADEEIRIGDNDTLAARVAVLTRADLLVLLSDIDGLYSANPRKNPKARKIAELDWVKAEHLEQFGFGAGQWGTGGMLTKLQAAMIAQESNIPMVLANSSTPEVLHRVLEGDREAGTWFMAGRERRPQYVGGTTQES